MSCSSSAFTCSLFRRRSCRPRSCSRSRAILRRLVCFPVPGARGRLSWRVPIKSTAPCRGLSPFFRRRSCCSSSLSMWCSWLMPAGGWWKVIWPSDGPVGRNELCGQFLFLPLVMHVVGASVCGFRFRIRLRLTFRGSVWSDVMSCSWTRDYYSWGTILSLLYSTHDVMFSPCFHRSWLSVAFLILIAVVFIYLYLMHSFRMGSNLQFHIISPLRSRRLPSAFAAKHLLTNNFHETPIEPPSFIHCVE